MRDATKQLLAVADRVLIKSYRQPPLVLARGQGAELWDTEGRRYLDMTAGIAVCCLGHAHPRLAEAIAEQARTLVHTSNLWFIEQQLRLAERLTSISFADRVFFANSGSEANEGAIKLARRYQRVVNGAERDTVVATDASFHGRSFATVALTGQPKYHADFGPLFGPVEHVPFGDLTAAERALAPGQACAFIVEPIQAEGGINVAPAGYLAGLRELCDRTGTVLIFDEVQTGVGRTGSWFAHQHDGVAPDVMTLAKALGGGVPIGAICASERAAEGLAFKEGGAVPHASTFGGNPLACGAADAVLRIIEDEGLLDNCVRMGEYLDEKLAGFCERMPSLCLETRGRGLLRGLRVARDAPAILGACRDAGLLVSVAGGDVIRFVPALNVAAAQLDEAVDLLGRVLQERA